MVIFYPYYYWVSSILSYKFLRCNKDRRKSSTGSGRSKLSSTGECDVAMSPGQSERQVDDEDDDHLVIADSVGQEIDLKCKEKVCSLYASLQFLKIFFQVTDSDSESHCDMEPPGMFSPATPAALPYHLSSFQHRGGHIRTVGYSPQPVKSEEPCSSAPNTPTTAFSTGKSFSKITLLKLIKSPFQWVTVHL